MVGAETPVAAMHSRTPPVSPIQGPSRGRAARLYALLACAALAGLGAATGSASAQGVRSLDDAPLPMFSEEDIRMMKGAIAEALDGDRKVEWKNAQTGSGGTATPGPAAREGCRLVAIENRHQARRATSQFQFCKVEGAWRLVSDTR